MNNQSDLTFTTLTTGIIQMQSDAFAYIIISNAAFRHLGEFFLYWQQSVWDSWSRDIPISSLAGSKTNELFFPFLFCFFSFLSFGFFCFLFLSEFFRRDFTFFFLTFGSLLMVSRSQVDTFVWSTRILFTRNTILTQNLSLFGYDPNMTSKATTKINLKWRWSTKDFWNACRFSDGNYLF